MSISAFMESFQGPLEGGKSSEEVVTHKQLALEEVIREPECRLAPNAGQLRQLPRQIVDR